MPIPPSVESLIDTYFMPLINTDGSPNANQAPGGICGVFHSGGVYYRSYGSINAAGDSPTQNTVFGLGSVTKTLTTSILGQQDPPLFTTSVNGYLPDGYELTQTEQPATFAQLATFTAGIIPSTPPKRGSTTQAQFQDFINTIVPINNTLPTPNIYSDSSIGLLAQSLMYMDNCSSFGQSETNTWFQDNLLTALNMTHTGAPAITDSEHPLSDAYIFNDNDYQKINYAGWVPWGAAGRAYSTCSDMMIFVQANAGCSTINGIDGLVPPTILEGMVQAQKPWAPLFPPLDDVKQGFAWVIYNCNTPAPISGKDGGLPGVSSYVTVCPAQKLGVVFLTNMQNLNTQVPAIRLTEALLAP